MKCKLFDSHAHYFDKRFESEHPGGADDILGNVLSENGEVGGIINVGTNIENSVLAVQQALRYNKMYAAVGIHPEDCLLLRDMDSELAKLCGMLDAAKEKKIVAIGEIGLDYHCCGDSLPDRKKQLLYFEAQMEIADKYGMPVIIHDRDAHGDCFDTVSKYKNVHGVFHSYSGSAEMAVQLCRRGWYISFSGTVTFKNAPKVREAVAAVPSDRILIETDAPYLAPHPYRGKLNHSGLIVNTANAIADILHTDVDNVIGMTYSNTFSCFNLL